MFCFYVYQATHKHIHEHVGIYVYVEDVRFIN